MALRDALLQDDPIAARLLPTEEAIVKKRGDDALVFAYCKLMEDRLPEVRELSLISLIDKLQDSPPVKITISSQGRMAIFNSAKNLLADTEPQIRGTAAGLIGYSEVGKPAIPYLMKAIKDESPPVCDYSRWSLACVWLTIELPVSELIQYLNDPDPDVRVTAVDALTRHKKRGSAEIVSALIKALKDKNAKVRMAAAQAFVDINVSEDVTSVMPALEDCLHDEDESVRKMAAAALWGIRLGLP